MKYHSKMTKQRLILLLLFVCILFSSCTNEKKKQYYPTIVLNNKVLEQEIIKYKNDLLKSEKTPDLYGDTVRVILYAKEINDSIKRFVLAPLAETELKLEYSPFFFITKVDGHDVFVGSTAFYGIKGKTHFSLSKESLKEFEEYYFPGYAQWKDKTGLSTIQLRHDNYRYLTFLNDSLIDRVDAMFGNGVHAKIKVRVGDKYMEY